MAPARGGSCWLRLPERWAPMLQGSSDPWQLPSCSSLRPTCDVMLRVATWWRRVGALTPYLHIEIRRADTKTCGHTTLGELESLVQELLPHHSTNRLPRGWQDDKTDGEKWPTMMMTTMKSYAIMIIPCHTQLRWHCSTCSILHFVPKHCSL
jgi:hypothetical protein